MAGHDDPQRHEQATTIAPVETEAATLASATRPLIARGLDTSGGSDFVKERLALLGKAIFILSFGFYLLLTLSMVIVGGAQFVEVVIAPVAIGHLCATSCMGLLWLCASRRKTSFVTLAALDAFCVIAGCAFLALMT